MMKNLLFLITLIAVLQGSSAQGCDAGYYIEDDECIQCPSGSISWEANSTECFWCDAGYYAANTTACLPCPGGSNSTQGSSACSCQPGMYLGLNMSYNEWGMPIESSLCMECSEGYYSHGALMTSYPSYDYTCMACPQGWVSAFGGDCSICAPGYYLEDGGCIQCARGSIAPDANSTECLFCAAGYFSLSTTKCEPCPGDSNSTQGSSECSCQPGTYWGTTSDDWSYQCVGCGEGYYSPGALVTDEISSNYTCMACPQGWASEFGNDCTICASGYYLEDDECIQCAPGTIAPGTGNTQCSPCEAGYYSASPTQCIPCQGGFSTEGSSACYCPPGYYWGLTFDPEFPKYQCVECGEGYYSLGALGSSQSSANNTCVACPQGWFSESGNNCTFCARGYYQEDGNCSICPAGTFSEAGSDECTQCSVGFNSTEGSSYCSFCAAGYFQEEIYGPCFECAAGTFSESGTNECTQCPAGSISSNASSSCTTCGAGQFAQDNECVSCPAGTFSEAGSTECTQCPVGSISSIGSSNCTECCAGLFEQDNQCFACSEGTYNDVPGATSCRVCPPGYNSTAGSVQCTPICGTGEVYDADNDQCVPAEEETCACAGITNSTNVTSSNISNADANLTNAANSTSYNMSNANATSYNMSNAYTNLTNANVTYYNMSNANATSYNMSNANATSYNMTYAGTNVTYSDMDDEFDEDFGFLIKRKHKKNKKHQN